MNVWSKASIKPSCTAERTQHMQKLLAVLCSHSVGDHVHGTLQAMAAVLA